MTKTMPRDSLKYNHKNLQPKGAHKLKLLYTISDEF